MHLLNKLNNPYKIYLFIYLDKLKKLDYNNSINLIQQNFLRRRRKMKNYIEKKGIKKEEILYITPKGSTIKILSFYNGIAECEIINPFPGGSPAGSKGKVKIQDMPNLQKLIDENKQK